MTTPDHRLAEALRALRPLARDPAFRLGLLERRARRRLGLRLAALAGAGLLLTALSLAVLPAAVKVLGPDAGPWAAAAPVLAALALAVGWSLVRMRRPI